MGEKSERKSWQVFFLFFEVGKKRDSRIKELPMREPDNIL